MYLYALGGLFSRIGMYKLACIPVNGAHASCLAATFTLLGAGRKTRNIACSCHITGLQAQQSSSTLDVDAHHDLLQFNSPSLHPQDCLAHVV